MEEKDKHKHKISVERKGLYYIGMAILITGFILFFSVFFIGMNEDPFSGDSGMGSMKNGFIGFILIGLGGFIMNIGARGAAGSGLILDPEKAREDLNPYTAAAGGMINDALQEVDILKPKPGEKDIVKVRCLSCRELNDEDARFCKNCGKEI